MDNAYKNSIEQYKKSWNRPVGSTISAKEIKENLQKQLNQKIKEFKEFECEGYKQQYGKEPDIQSFYKEIFDDELTIDNRFLEYYQNPCYGAYVEGMDYPDIHLKIKFIVSNGKFYIFLENSYWYGRNTQIDKRTLNKWNNMITSIYYKWLINDIPVCIENKYRAKVRKLMKG